MSIFICPIMDKSNYCSPKCMFYNREGFSNTKCIIRKALETYINTASQKLINEQPEGYCQAELDW